jgi:hypothetical protein
MEHLGYRGVPVSGVQKWVIRYEGRVPGSHVCKYYTRPLLTGIRLLLNFLFEAAIDWFSGLLKAVPSTIVKPAVIQTAEAAALAATVAQISCPVRAVKPKQPGAATTVTK